MTRGTPNIPSSDVCNHFGFYFVIVHNFVYSYLPGSYSRRMDMAARSNIFIFARVKMEVGSYDVVRFV